MPSAFGPLRVDPDDPRPLYVQIAHEVRRAVAQGAISPGTALPSVRELAAGLRLNPNTVLQAYRELEGDGLVETRRGRGTFVAPLTDRDQLRQSVAREVARRCLHDAARAGLSLEGLISALRQEDEAGRTVPSPDNPSPSSKPSDPEA